MNLQTLVVQPTNSVLVQILRYGVVGMMAFIVDFTVMVALAEIGQLNYLLAAAIGFVAGLAVNYYLSTAWVFDHRRMSTQSVEFTIFAVIGIAGLGLTELILWTGTDLCGVDYRVSKVLAVVLVLGWNFGLRKTLLFRSA